MDAFRVTKDRKEKGTVIIEGSIAIVVWFLAVPTGAVDSDGSGCVKEEEAVLVTAEVMGPCITVLTGADGGRRNREDMLISVTKRPRGIPARRRRPIEEDLELASNLLSSYRGALDRIGVDAREA